jgi:hypothetical protein
LEPDREAAVHGVDPADHHSVMLGASFSPIAIGYAPIFGVLHFIHLATGGSYAVLVSDCAASHTAAGSCSVTPSRAPPLPARGGPGAGRLSHKGDDKTSKSSVF